MKDAIESGDTDTDIIRCIVNGREHVAHVEDRTLLIDVLRDQLRLTGPRIGCEDGACGACTVEIDGSTIKSCLVLAKQADGAEVATVEGLAEGAELSRIQDAFVQAGAQQCGYCTSGMIMSAQNLLKRNKTPSEEEIRDALNGNVCRCTGYRNIIRAVQIASGQVNGPERPDDQDVDSWVGASIPRKEDRRLVSGGGQYTGDFLDSDALHCAIKRSSIPHGRILSIDTSKAEALPGVENVVTGKDALAYWEAIPPTWDASGFGGKMPKGYPMAVDKVRFVGEPIAAVVASSSYIAEDALELIEVQYEALPTILNEAQAVPESGEPEALLYEEWGDNIQIGWPAEYGDVAAAFDAADLVVEDDFSSHRYNVLPMETRVVYARFDAIERRLLVRASIQIPHAARAFFAKTFGLKESNVQVIAGDVGGGFGGKLGLDPEYIPILMSIVTGRPVKWMESRTEWLTAGPQGRDFKMNVKAAFKADGTLLGLKTKIHADVGCDGAERAGGLGMPVMAATYAPGGYKLPAYGMEVRCFVTNKAPYGATRGYGKDIANMAMERMLDKAADALSIDKFAIRSQNLTDTYPHQILTGPIIESGSLRQSLSELREMMDIEKLDSVKADCQGSKRRGYAAVSYIEPCGGSLPNSIYQNYEAATVRLNQDGTARVMTGVQNIGQGVLTAMAHVAADCLGIVPDDVTVTTGDTDSTPFGAGAYSGRGATYGTGAVLLAAGKVQERIKAAAAFLLECDASNVILKNGRATLTSDPQKSVTLEEVAHAVYFWPGAEASLKGIENPSLEHSAVYTCPQTSWVPDADGHAQFYTAHPGGAVGAFVEVDIETGHVEVLNIWDVSDHGTIIHPPSVDGQIMGGTMQQLAQTLIEENAYDDKGYPKYTTIREYGSPTIMLAPKSFEIKHIETPSEGTSIGAKGVGEAGCIATTTVLMAAVEDALRPLGVTRVTHAPLTPWAIKASIDAAKGS